MIFSSLFYACLTHDTLTFYYFAIKLLVYDDEVWTTVKFNLTVTQQYLLIFYIDLNCSVLYFISNAICWCVFFSGVIASAAVHYSLAARLSIDYQPLGEENITEEEVESTSRDRENTNETRNTGDENEDSNSTDETDEYENPTRSASYRSEKKESETKKRTKN